MGNFIYLFFLQINLSLLNKFVQIYEIKKTI